MMSSALIAAVALSFLVYRLVNDGAPPGFPRIGSPGAIGYIISALRFLFHSQEILDEGREKFDGRPFAVPTMAGWLIILSPEHLETLRASNDVVFSQPIQINETLQLDHTMDPNQQRFPFQATVIRNELTKGIATFIPEILDETTLAMADSFKVPSDTEYASVPLFYTMTHMIARISNRAMLGSELCRNNDFIHTVVAFAETLIVYAQLLQWAPAFLRPSIYFVLSTIWGGKKEPLAFLKPYVAKRLEERSVAPHIQPFTIAEFLLNNAPPGSDVDDLAMRVLNVNFGSIHTSSIFITQALFEMSQMSPEDVDSIRSEITQAVEEEGGWNKGALNRFKKLDSILREVGRVHGLSLLGMQRLTIDNGHLLDGTVVPAGYVVSIYLRDIHFDSKVYSNPQVFDPFRFSKLREDEETNVKYGFTTVDHHFLSFGAGRHACPGRFFASMELKLMLSHILMNYEFKLPDGLKHRPRSVILAGSVMPPMKDHLLFRPRPAAFKGR